MNTSSLLLGIVPLLVFVIVDSFAGFKKALIMTVVMAILESAFTIYYFKELDFVSVICLVSVIVFCGISFFKNSSLFVKLQPVFLSAILGVLLIGSYFYGKPLLMVFALKYKDFLPTQFSLMLENVKFLKLLEISTLTLGVSHLAHALVVWWSALKLNNWWWLAIRGIGYYLFMFLGLFSAKLFL